MDVLSDTLRVVRLTGAIFLNMRWTSPWAVESEPPDLIAQYLRLPSDCLALFHILVRGQGWFSVPGYTPVLLRPGDAILLPHCTPHVMSSDHRTTLAPTLLRYVLPSQAPEGIAQIEGGGSGAITEFICGYLHCDQRFNPLIGALPALIVANRCEDGRDGVAPAPVERGASRSPVLSIAPGDWLGMTLYHMIEEALGKHPGGSDMVARLSEILYVEMVRRYMQRLTPSDHGWLAGVRDPVVGQTLRRLHAQPERAWTVGELADAAAVSRSTLAQRFTALIGGTPMRYLAGWRVQLAKHLLRETDMRLAEIAERVGYESEAAFNRAFKRYAGQPPAAWRAGGEGPRVATR
jgi:AraC family transcriptional regulator, alkane utilization regulator